MQKMKTKLYILGVLLMLAIPVFAAPLVALAEASPAPSIDYCNLTFEDETYIKYAVSFEGVPDDSITRFNTGMLYWTEPQSSYTVSCAEYSSDIIGYTFIEGEKYYTFSYDKLTAKQMTDYIYSVAYVAVNGTYYYSDVAKYSILTYAYDKLGYTGTPSDSAEYRATLRDLLEYGAAAQSSFGYRTDRPANGRYYQLTVDGGRLPDGTSRGLYLKGECVRVSSNDGSRVTEITVAEENIRVNAITGEISRLHSCELNRKLISETAPTCTTDGYYLFACGVCGGSETRAKASELTRDDPFYDADRHGATGHDFSYVSHTSATCEENGYDTYLCKNGCFVIKAVALDDDGVPLYPALGHKIVSTAVLPSCNPDSPNHSGFAGVLIEKCSVCSYVGDDKRIEFDYNDPTHHPGAFMLRVIREGDGETSRLTEWACPSCSSIFVVEEMLADRLR